MEGAQGGLVRSWLGLPTVLLDSVAWSSWRARQPKAAEGGRGGEKAKKTHSRSVPIIARVNRQAWAAWRLLPNCAVLPSSSLYQRPTIRPGTGQARPEHPRSARSHSKVAGPFSHLFLSETLAGSSPAAEQSMDATATVSGNSRRILTT